MPTPGPRIQGGPIPGYNNPGQEQPTRWNRWDRPGPLWWPGRSPGLMQITLRGNTQGYGQIRRLYRQAINYLPAQAAYSWTANGIVRGSYRGVDITRGLRYMTRSVYAANGTDNSRYANLHTFIGKQNFYKTPTVGAGQVRNRPTVRNRLTSFGSRVPTLNSQVSAAESQSPVA